MKKCTNCNVTVNTEYNTCPLCFKELTEAEGEINEIFKHRENIETKKPKKPLLFKIFLFLSVITTIVCLVTNLMVAPFPLWSLVVIISIIYIWILIAHTIVSKRSIFEKLLLQIGTVIGLLFACEWISNGKNWMVDYVIPSISIAIIVVLFILSLSLKNHKGLLAFFIMNVVLTLLSGILLICKVPTFNLINLITVIIGGVSILGSLLFSGHALKIELSKKFHI